MPRLGRGIGTRLLEAWGSEPEASEEGPWIKKVSPNRDPFPRGRFLKGSDPIQKIHALRRKANTNVFQQANPNGYQHDLGAQDIPGQFWAVLHEQVTAHEWREYAAALDLLMLQWELLKHRVLKQVVSLGKQLWLGRRANAGEPRSLLRWITNQDCSRIRLEFLEEYLGSPSISTVLTGRSRSGDLLARGWAPLGLDTVGGAQPFRPVQ